MAKTNDKGWETGEKVITPKWSRFNHRQKPPRRSFLEQPGHTWNGSLIELKPWQNPLLIKTYEHPMKGM